MKIDLLEKKRELIALLDEESARRDEPQQQVMTEEFGLAFTNQDGAPGIQEFYIGDMDGRYQIDGIGMGDSDADEDPAFHLVITDFDSDTEAVGSLNAADIDRLVGRVMRAVETITDPSFLETQEDQWKTSILGNEIVRKLGVIPNFKIVIFSTRELRMRGGSFKARTLLGKTVRTAVADIKYWAEYELSGQSSLEIDFIESFGKGIPCLHASTHSAEIESYLLAIEGKYLAEIYASYGDRLLESNIRTFLSVKKDSVNDGMQRTIANNPNQFFAFNNGITATAESVETAINPETNCLELTKLTSLQIVNGGQTTASLKYARDKTGLELEDIYVQVKLNVLKNEETEPNAWASQEDKNHDIVRKIARYSNTQNKVSASDLESNHKLLIELERQVKALKTPPRGDNNYSEDWFFERSRGRYNNLFAYKRGAELAKLKAQYPKHQYLEKTKAARYYLVFETDRFKKVPRGSWKVNPEAGLVGATQACHGVQRAFEIFMAITKERFEKTPGIISRIWASDFVAKAIIYIQLDKAVNASSWYRARKGYKAQTINYTLGLCAAALSQKGLALDTRKIWQTQEVPEELLNRLVWFAKAVSEIIFTADPSQSNPSQFAKYNIAWRYLEHLIENIPEELFSYAMPKDAWEERLGLAAEMSTQQGDMTLWEQLQTKYQSNFSALEQHLKMEERYTTEYKNLLQRLITKRPEPYKPGDGDLLKKMLIEACWEDD